jgi:ABC-type proline/glycine betaine transport system substrate-binding protein
MKTKTKMLTETLVMIVLISSAAGDDEQATNKTINIANLVWMSENLNVSFFRNGELIPEAKSDDEWARAC